MYEPNNIAERINFILKSKSIRQKTMLENCGLSKNTISSMLSRGSMLKADNLAVIADYLDCSVDYLLGRETANESTNISHVSNSVVMHTNRGNHVSISNGASNSDNQLSEQEEELVRTFRTLDMRRKTTALTFLYQLEDQTSENRT